MLPIIFVVPVFQLVILTYAADFELKNIKYVIVDRDRSQESERLLARFNSSKNFHNMGERTDFKDGMEALDRNQATLLVRIPNGFSRDLQKEKNATIMLDVNSIDGQAASLSYTYASEIIRKFNDEIAMEWNGLPQKASFPVEVKTRYWFNPEMEYKNLMVPGILAMLVTMVGMFLSSMNVVREKEIGTIEQINVTPVSKIAFLTGKLTPFWILSIFELSFGLVIGKLLFDIPLSGSLGLLYGFTAVYLLVILGLGLLISTMADTQQQAMFLSWFFMVIFILMSGLFTPIENMPVWAQKLTLLNPIAYIVKVIRAVLLKGSTFADIKNDFIVMAGFAVVILSMAVYNYKKRA